MGLAGAGSAGERWCYAFELEQLPVLEARAVTLETGEVVVVRVAENELYAIEGHCPHDGEPLVNGRVEACRLICSEDRAQFDLKTGASLRGGEDAEVFSVRVRDGKVEVREERPKAEQFIEKRLKSFKDALVGGRLSHAVRELVRLSESGVEPSKLALEVAAFDAAHHEQGAGLALSLAADILRITPRYLGLDVVLPLANLVEVAMDESKHRAPRKVPASQDPGREADGVGARLIALLEAGDAEAADGLVRGALWRKWTREQVEPWFYELNTAHFLGGGHGLVACVKAFELLEAVGFEHARRILPALTYALACMPRDDTLSAWQWFRQRFAQLEPRLEALWTRANQRQLGEDERQAVARAILDGSREEAWHAVIGAFAAGGRVECVIDALSRAAAERLWRFDPAIDRDSRTREGWLDVARPFLYVHALRTVARRHRKPGLLKMVLFGVRLVNHQKRLDLPADRWTAVDAKGRTSFVERERFLRDMMDMIRERETVEAQRAGLAYLSHGGSLDAMHAALCDVVLRGRYARPSFVAHGIHLAVAVCEESAALPESERTWPLRALIRMLSSPVCEQSIEAVVHEARRVASEGTGPRTPA